MGIFCIEMATVYKTFQYRIYPTHLQETLLENTLENCRLLYNKLLEQRNLLYEFEEKSIGCYDQISYTNYLKDNEIVELKTVHSQVLQNVAIRVELAFQAFFRRIKSGDTPGYPRFKGYGRYDSFTYPQTGFKIIDNQIKLSKIGNVDIKLHRPIEGTIKSCTIKRSSTNKWFITFSCEIESTEIIEDTSNAIGIDVGLHSFATLSDSTEIENPRFFRKEQKALAKEQRKLSEMPLPKDSTPTELRKRNKQKKRVSRIHERTRNKRKNFCHQQSRKIVNTYNTIFVEDINVNRLLQKEKYNTGMHKSLTDAAWSMFFDFLTYKAADAGKLMIKVNPAYTSQTCSACGHRHAMSLNDRQFICECCGLSLDRDLNAAVNIKALGLQSLA